MITVLTIVSALLIVFMVILFVIICFLDNNIEELEKEIMRQHKINLEVQERLNEHLEIIITHLRKQHGLS